MAARSAKTEVEVREDSAQPRNGVNGSQHKDEKADRRFDPSRYLRKLAGREYLEVKWRLLWLRTEHPDAAMETEMVRLEDGFALFKARVAIPGGGEATGWGSETRQDFFDFVEKAESASR